MLRVGPKKIYKFSPVVWGTICTFYKNFGPSGKKGRTKKEWENEVQKLGHDSSKKRG